MDIKEVLAALPDEFDRAEAEAAINAKIEEARTKGKNESQGGARKLLTQKESALAKAEDALAKANEDRDKLKAQLAETGDSAASLAAKDAEIERLTGETASLTGIRDDYLKSKTEALIVSALNAVHEDRKVADPEVAVALALTKLGIRAELDESGKPALPGDASEKLAEFAKSEAYADKVYGAPKQQGQQFGHFQPGVRAPSGRTSGASPEMEARIKEARDSGNTTRARNLERQAGLGR